MEPSRPAEECVFYKNRLCTLFKREVLCGMMFMEQCKESKSPSRKESNYPIPPIPRKTGTSMLVIEIGE